MDKNGFAISFSWLFSIIVGMSIFLFFVWFAVQQTDLFGNLTAQVAVEELDIAFTGFKSSLVGTSLDFGKIIDLEFKCDPDETLGKEKMFINGRAGKSLKGKIVFAPSEMNSNEFNLWTIDWNAPFKVTNFIFLSEKSRGYDLSEMSSDPLKKLKENIPNFFITDSGEQIAFSPRSGPISCGNGKEIHWEYDSDIDEIRGVICVGDSRTNGYDFVGDAMVYAAIFADKDNFGCLYEIAEDKAGDIEKFHKERLSLNAPLCRTTSLDGQFDFSDIVAIKKIASENDRLLRSSNCEAIY